MTLMMVVMVVITMGGGHKLVTNLGQAAHASPFGSMSHSVARVMNFFATMVGRSNTPVRLLPTGGQLDRGILRFSSKQASMKCLNLIPSLTSCMIVTMKTQYHPVPVRARTRPPSTTVKRSNCSGSQLCYHRINEAPCQVYKQPASKNATQVLASTCSSACRGV